MRIRQGKNAKHGMRRWSKPMHKTFNGLAYDVSLEVVGLLIGLPAGLVSALYARAFQNSS
jgi:hypothetical protein